MNLILLFEVYVIILTKEVNCRARHRFSFGQSVDVEEATVGMFPYQVAIFYEKIYFYGGALIAQRWVLTSAVCVERGPIWYINMGGIYSNEWKYEPSRMQCRSNVGLIHPHRTSENYSDNNIGLLKVYPKPYLGATINTILLPKLSTLNNSLTNVEIRVIGWGRIARVRNDRLSYADYKVIPVKQCALEFDPGYAIFCSKALKPVNDTVAGNGGGPAVLMDADNSTLEGIIIYRSKTMIKYVRTTYYLKWIHAVTDVPIRP